MSHLTLRLSRSLAASLLFATTTISAFGQVTDPAFPLQNVAGASHVYSCSDAYEITQRSNSGSAMADTLMNSTASCLINGTQLQISNVDAAAAITVTSRSGTTINGSSTLTIGSLRSVWLTYDIANTAWRPQANSAAALIGHGAFTPGDALSVFDGNGRIQDAGSTPLLGSSSWTGGDLGCTGLAPCVLTVNGAKLGQTTNNVLGYFGTRDTAGGCDGSGNSCWFGFNALLQGESATGQNAVAGIIINNLPAGTFAFPTGVTGAGVLAAGSSGNQAFGLFATCSTYAAGVCTNEVDTFNFSGAPSGNLPPNEGIGTTETLPIGLQLVAFGNYNSAIGLQVGASSSSNTQKYLTGIYEPPYGNSTYGLDIDSTGSTGAAIGAVIKNPGNNYTLQLVTTGTYSANSSVIDVDNANANSVFSVRQSGDIYVSNLFSAGKIDAENSAGSVGLDTATSNNIINARIINNPLASGPYNDG